MNKENLIVSSRFVESWEKTPRERLVPEIISLFKETHRQADNYHLLSINGKIVDPETRQEVNIDRTSYIGKSEGKHFDKLEKWADENSQGNAVWISPMCDGIYPCNKIIFYQIAYSFGSMEKSLLNHVILFDSPKNHCLKIANKIDPQFESLENPEELRNKLIVVDDEFNIASLLAAMLSQENTFPTPSLATISYFVDLIHQGQNSKFIATEMQKRGIVGEHSISCKRSPSTYSNYMDTRALVLNFSTVEGQSDKYGSLQFTCNSCGRINTRPLNTLLTNCQHCNADVRC